MPPTEPIPARQATTGAECVAVAQRRLDAAPDVVRLVESIRDEGAAWLLESALQDGRLGRHSFVGADPYAVLTFAGASGALEVRRAVRAGWSPGRHPVDGDPFEAARALLPRLSAAAAPPPQEAELPFVGGAIALFGYELAERIESIGLDQVADLDTPDLTLLLVDRLVSIDHVTGEAVAVTLGFGENRAAAEAAASEALADWSQTLMRRLHETGSSATRIHQRTDATGEGDGNAVADTDAVDPGPGRAEYGRRVRSILDRIECGSVYEVNLTQRMSRPWRGDALALYEALRRESPAPFAAFVELPGVTVVGSSPERYLRVGADGWVESRPIKGTRPRGETPSRDAELAEELVTSPKDRAENLMIVDLVRNDLGRVCRPGSVRVPELMQVEAYATVFQLVSTVIGRLRDECDAVDLVRASFPPGSMTGAPKIAAMQIAGELEPVRRGLYSGALGYLDVRGGLDLSVTIRTCLVKKGHAYVHVGGAVVADSDPGAEYDECFDKARALLDAIEAASEDPAESMSERMNQDEPAAS